MQPAVKGVVLDLAASVCATGVVFVTAVGTSLFSDMRLVLLMMAVLFVTAGLVRGGAPQANGGLKALLLISVCLLVFGFASGAPRLLLGLLVVVSWTAALAGISARRGWAGHPARSVATVVAVLGVIAVGSEIGAPVIVRRLLTFVANKPAIEFSVVRLDGGVVNSSELKGRVAVIDFWATWCPPCRQEFPELEKLYKRYRADPRVVLLAVDVNKEGETPEKAGAFVRKAGYTIPVAFDAKDAVSRLKAEGYPHLLLLDKAGRVRLEHVGYDGAEHFVENLSREINKLVAEPL
ncbi:MAG TPA: TlpA disulfide reductase family protein [Bryobacteraceae bacterium]|nr:TlpA disulfide reductase family protein [Bryobacteraceae bacterium]